MVIGSGMFVDFLTHALPIAFNIKCRVNLKIGVVTPPQRMENGRMENEEKEEPIRYLLHGERCDTPLWPVENGEWRMRITIAARMW